MTNQKFMLDHLIEKYNVPAPRYTSYPTVPYWETEPPTSLDWLLSTQRAIAKNQEISLYIHLPFCENLCTYCACNKRITKNHSVEQPYIQSLLQEWQIYVESLQFKPKIKTIHLGGGTPTFFSSEQLHKLIKGIFEHASIAPDHEFSFEAHPSNTTYDHLYHLHQLGFNRISIGVQDFDDQILHVINRKQTQAQVETVTQQARAMGYNSINYDLIFGLPFQTPKHIAANMRKVKQLRPDRIAFYSYAHVPWKNPSQRMFSIEDLPVGNEKRALYELGKKLLQQIGYEEIGMDHFALPTDELCEAAEMGQLHRNFMGYTNRNTRLAIGLGTSAISDSWEAFVQNEKKVETYQKIVATGRLPIAKGHLLTKEDQILRKHILNLSCNFETHWKTENSLNGALLDGLARLKPLEADGLVEISFDRLKVTELGKKFIRNICMALDARFHKKKRTELQFSQAV